MKNKMMKKVIALCAAAMMIASMTACGSKTEAPAEEKEEAVEETEETAEAEGAEYRVGICNFVDDASLNQIVANIKAQLDVIAQEKGVTFIVDEQNCNADDAVMTQIIANFQADNDDIMVGVATPVAVKMQAATEDTGLPVVFSAVSDPVGAGLVESMEAPGANLTGTSDFLDTESVMALILAENPDCAKIGLLYDLGQDSSTLAIAQAKEFCEKNGIEVVEANGTTTSEVQLAVDSLIQDNVDAIFTPTDNTIMTAELSIYEAMIEAGIPHYTGADSFALNGAFAGYGVDYANLGVETANIIAKILLDGAEPAATPVMTFNNGIATLNIETCAAIGKDVETVKAAFAPNCTQVVEITTAESFDDLK